MKNITHCIAENVFICKLLKHKFLKQQSNGHLYVGK
jgi:hypothetical protein